MFISATGNISPQKTFGHQPLLTEPVDFSGNRLNCSEPDYKNLIDVKLIRRMSRIIRMGVAAAMECLNESGVLKPDAIVTGTAYGCLEDTGLFLGKMIEFNEELLTPTAFIQSTHNTIGAQIGLMLQCNNYNNAFVHRGFSFENALQDAIMLLNEKAAENVLVGSIDEITDNSHAILSRFGLYKQQVRSSLDIYNSNSKGTVAGEGAAFFLLANNSSADDYAKLDALSIFYKPEGILEIEKEIHAFLKNHSLSLDDIDLVITGRNGDLVADRRIKGLHDGIFSRNACVDFKHLCGEFPTASGFALWLAANIIRHNHIPAILDYKGPSGKKVNRILICNQYMNIHHSLFLVSSC